MPRKKSYITVKDQFCGSGGSSQGARAAGAEIKYALNHWKLAIETHNTNFPDTIHDCTDISACDPRRYGSTDILITSPECTNHSLAKGKKIVKKQMDLFASGKLDPAAERSRATMWDVPRFAEYHNYNAVIVENVVDARKWVMFDAWLKAMHSLGYLHECVFRNSKHYHPTPQSRDRMYVVFWKKGNHKPNLNFTPLAHCNHCGKDVHAIQSWKPRQNSYKYQQGYLYCCPTCSKVVEPYYYASFNCIDWSDIGTRIGDRSKPLSENTIKRIQYGLDKFDNIGLVINDQHSTGINCRVKSVHEQLGTITSAPHFKLIQPYLIDGNYDAKPSRATSSFNEMDTVTTQHRTGIVTPFILKCEHAEQLQLVRAAYESMQTQVTRQSMALVTPFIVENKGQSKSKAITDATGCLTTKPHLGLVTNEAWNSFIAYNRSQDPTHITSPVQTVATVEQLSMINYQKPNIEDCYYRMLKPHEIKLAMAFNKDYVVLGSGKDQVKQLGNAVTPPVMEWLVRQVIKSLN